MAHPRFPLTVTEKHRVMHTSPAPPAQLAALGDRYRDAGLYHDALDLYEAAGSTEALESLLGEAVEQADPVLLLNAYRALGRDPEPAKLVALRDRAVSSGKESVAARIASLLISSH